MRKSRDEASQTRKRIVSTAAAEMRRNGVIASGLNELMAAAGLTRGGFYKHFESKNQLVAEATAEAMNSAIADLTKAAASKGTSPSAEYLSTRHRDHPEMGCPLSAVGAELARCDDTTRSIATDGFLQLVKIMSDQFSRGPSAASRQQAIAAVSAMVGALTMSRTVNDPKLSAEILRATEKRLAESALAAR